MMSSSQRRSGRLQETNSKADLMEMEQRRVVRTGWEGYVGGSVRDGRTGTGYTGGKSSKSL